MVTILIAPLMTCSARLPLYALLIGAFIPRREVRGGPELQGLVLLALHVAGILGGLGVTWLRKQFTTRSGAHLMMEMPTYHWPTARDLAIGLWQRIVIFTRRVGGIIPTLTILLWFLASFPALPAGASGPRSSTALAERWAAHWPLSSSRLEVFALSA
jgi:ferrous iron transport protein B